MINGTGKLKRQLAFELQSSRVFEKRSKPFKMMQDFRCCFILALFLNYVLSKITQPHPQMQIHKSPLKLTD